MDRALEPPVAARALSAKRSARPLLAELEASLGYSFRDKALLKQALTHVSAVDVARRGQSYERLEFLGDRVLGLAISEWLFLHHSAAREGEMSLRLAQIVRKESCAAVAMAWGVGPHLYLGPSEQRSRGRDKPAILGDACEALIGAVLCDADYASARAVVWRGFATRFVGPGPVVSDAKTVLQEWAQARGLPPPLYRQADRSGPDHLPRFVIQVEVETFLPLQGEGASKRLAEQVAAKAFLIGQKLWAQPEGGAAATTGAATHDAGIDHEPANE